MLYSYPFAYIQEVILLFFQTVLNVQFYNFKIFVFFLEFIPDVNEKVKIVPQVMFQVGMFLKTSPFVLEVNIFAITNETPSFDVVFLVIIVFEFFDKKEKVFVHENQYQNQVKRN